MSLEDTIAHVVKIRKERGEPELVIKHSIKNKAWRIKQEDLKNIYKFIKLNKIILLKLWNEEVSQMNLGQNLASITK